MGLERGWSVPRSSMKLQPWQEWCLFSLGAAATWPIRALYRHPRPARYQQLYVRTTELVRAGKLVQRPPKVRGIQDLLGKVVAPGDWDLRSTNREMTWKTKTLLGLMAGLGPEQSGYMARMEALIARDGVNHGCTDAAAAMRRARELESMIEQLRQDRRLKERSEIDPWAFRERGGIEVTIGRDGTVYRSGDGGHRGFFVEVLGIEAIPVAVTAIHPDAIRNGSFRRLLRESNLLRVKTLSKTDTPNL